MVGGRSIQALQSIERNLCRACTVVVAINGPEILEKCLKTEPEIVVIDVIMTGMSSREVIRRIRRQPNGRTRKILVYSHVDREGTGDVSMHQMAVEIDQARRACLEAGADASVGGYEPTAFMNQMRPYLKGAGTP